MTASFITMLWHILLILLLWLVTYYTIAKFGNRILAFILTKEIRVVHQHHDAISARDQQRVETLTGVFTKVLRAVVLVVFGSMILLEINIPLTPLFAGAGVIGVVLGLGAQSLLKDIFAGTFIIMENQYGKGDTVKLGDVKGKVIDLSLRTTVIRDDNNVVYHIPNGSVAFTSNYSQVNK